MWPRAEDDSAYQQWYNDPRTVLKMVDEALVSPVGGRCCPTCHVPFDKGKRRRITDDCGHERCYYCMLSADGAGCPICAATEAAKAPLSHPSRLRMKTNGHFTAFMQTRGPCARGPSSAPGVTSPKTSHTAWRDRKVTRPSTVSVDSHSALSDDEFSPPAPVADHLYTRLGLLLGQPGSQGSFASASSLANSSTNTSPISTLTGSSEAGAMSILGREESSDSVGSLMSTSSSPSPARRTATPNQQRNNSRRGCAALRCSTDSQALTHAGAQLYHQASLQPALKPLFFQVPQPDQEAAFVGRQWLFDQIDEEFEKDNSRGVVIVGCPGSGKTAAILQLVESSTFGRKKEEFSCGTAGAWPGGPDGGGREVGGPARRLGAQLVAYHFCQADNSGTCLVPEFVHSVAAQLCQAPQLAAYRDLLRGDPRLQGELSLASCRADPAGALVRGVLEPLGGLSSPPHSRCLLVVDALDEAELHRPDYGPTIGSLLAGHAHRFPAWLKLVVTVRTAFQETAAQLALPQFSLDRLSLNESLMRDLVGYILYRIESSPAARANITVNNGKQDGSVHARFAQHVAHLSKGCFLYAQLTMDLIERGHLVVKSSSYKVLPVSLSEVYLLSFNLRFPTTRAFERVRGLLQVCVASLSPLRPHELYHSVNAGATYDPMTWADFQQRLGALTSAQFLVQRNDGSLMLSHPSLREWLTRRDENDSTKFLCDVRAGHACIALRLSRIEAPLAAAQLMELGHHVLKAHLYRGLAHLPPECGPRDLQALWLFLSATDIGPALAAPSNLHSPNVKVSRLLLLAHADPNTRTSCRQGAPLLALAACEGFADMVSSLVEFGADIDAASDAGHTPLSMACQQGHLAIAQYLLAHGARVDRVDRGGLCALVHAASRGHRDVVAHLVQRPGGHGAHGLGLARAAQQALVEAAKAGHTEVCELLLGLPEVRLDGQDPSSGHTALSAASLAGQPAVCALLLRRGASARVCTRAGDPPLCCAVRGGHWAATEPLLGSGTLDQVDSRGRSPLTLAAAEKHLGVLELLLAKGAGPLCLDEEGRSALSWACSLGRLRAAQCLLAHGASVHQADHRGRTPLDMAAARGDARAIKLLLNNGAEVEHVDLNGTRALDRAIASGSLDAVNCFLQVGAKIGSQTWELAADKPSVVHLLLSKLHQDGALLYRRDHLKDAAHRYQYALKKFPASLVEDADSRSIFLQLKHQLLLGLAKCKRKLNEPDAAISASTQAIELRPRSFEGHFIRAKAHRDKGCQAEAQADIKEALRLAPVSNVEQRQTLLKVQLEIGSGGLEELPGTQYLSTRSSLDGRSSCSGSMERVCGISVESSLNEAAVHLPHSHPAPAQHAALR